MGAIAGEIHPAPAGEAVAAPRNQANYRITDSDGLGEGSAKDKYRQNVLAI